MAAARRLFFYGCSYMFPVRSITVATVMLRALDRVRGRALGLLGSGSPKSQPHQALRGVSKPTTGFPFTDGLFPVLSLVKDESSPENKKHRSFFLLACFPRQPAGLAHSQAGVARPSCVAFYDEFTRAGYRLSGTIFRHLIINLTRLEPSF